jgi:hypothetical protein
MRVANSVAVRNAANEKTIAPRAASWDCARAIQGRRRTRASWSTLVSFSGPNAAANQG